VLVFFCVLSAAQSVLSNGWSEFYCSGDLCIKHKPNDATKFCRICNFEAAYRKVEPVPIVAILPTTSSHCELVLGSITQAESKRLKRGYDLVVLKREDFAVTRR